jgi:parvulin-like peptidyl-prolyl isomerase
MEHSEDTVSARKGGDIGYITKEQVVPEFGEAAFKQKVGVVGPIIKTQFGQHIVLVTDKSAGGMQSLSDVKADLKAYLMQQKMQQTFDNFIKGLKDKSKIEFVDKTLSPEVLDKELELALSKYQKFQKTQRAPKSKKKILDKIEQEQKAKKEAENKKEEK